MHRRSTLEKLALLAGLTLGLACAGQPTAEVQPPLDESPAGSVPAASTTPPPAAPLPDPGPAIDIQPGPLATPPEGDPVEAPGTVEVPADALDGEAIESDSQLADSLAAFEAATALWGEGKLEEAFAELDHAYELMAHVPSEGDAALLQEKDNLRQLISKRVLEIYASRQSAVGKTDLSIPRLVNPEVEREIQSFQTRERDFFVESYRRSGLYRPMILKKLEAAGLPEALSWLPIVESGFKERALSSARAVGLWQFIPSTGYRYGLERNDWIDERMDPEKATDAAIGYLTDLHGLLGDWMTALAAYNCGEKNVLRQIERQKEGYFDQFWDLYARLPQETRRYVPRFLATLAILEDPAKYGFELPEPMAPVAYETVPIARATKLENLDKAMGLESGTLAKLNPELRRNASPKSTYPLKVPPGQGQALVASVGTLPEWVPPKVEVTTHRVRSGETLSQIATRYGTSVDAIMALNHLRSANRLSVGQRLQVPSGRAPKSASTEAASGGGASRFVAEAKPAAVALAPGASVRHEVRAGDNLWRIAARYGTTVEQIKADNGLRGNDLQPGQVLTIRSAAPGGA